MAAMVYGVLKAEIFTLCILLCAICFGWSEIRTGVVTYSQRSFIIHGRPLLLFSGSVHYTRVPPSDWNSVFRLAKELGLNCIQTYVIWSEHEPTPGNYNWEGYGDLVRFIDLAAANDLYVVVRIGPYICGEYTLGGLPIWLRNATDDTGKPIECFRCSDPVWKREMQQWVTVVVNKIRPQLASNGGPVIWLQIENEYEPDDEYLEWAVTMARNITTDIPWSLCGHAIAQCNKLNQRLRLDHQIDQAEHNTRKVLCTINGFWMDKKGGGDQPGPEFYKILWSDNATQPAIWTEDQGWFDVWGMGKRVRWTEDQLYGMARFYAHGGSYHNFYMLTGGNNYGLRAGRDATTAYAADTVIDNLLLRHEPRFAIYRDFFRVLKIAERELLQHSIPVAPIPLNSSATREIALTNSTAEAHEYGDLVFLSNTGENSTASGFFSYQGEDYFITNHTVLLLNASCSMILFNSSAPTSGNGREEQHGKDLYLKQSIEVSESKAMGSSITSIPVSKWVFFKEEVGYGAINHDLPRISPEQLNITENQSDYLWYTFYTSDAGKIIVKSLGWGGVHYSYVNGILTDIVATTDEKEAIPEEQRLLVGNYGNDNRKRIDILSVAMGLSTVVSPQTGKGIESVTVGEGNPKTNFSTAWKLKGEDLAIYTDKGSEHVVWQPLASLNRSDGLIWLKASFDLPNKLALHAGKAQPNQTALVLNLTGLNKGMAYVNGFNIGRYWLISGRCDGDCAPPRHGEHCFIHWKACGEPTQHLYHVPFEVLRPTGNNIVLFEETAPSTARNLKQVQVEIVRNHPN